MRISLTVQRNLAQAADEENIDDDDRESRAIVDQADVKLQSKNVVLNFSEH